ncbi:MULTISPECIES: hypothetical protein [Nostocales]|uniref:Uncharacterized protein n=2 Tax=Nostocales TaxID=1161 RepID=A0ABW8WXG2_9CYAN|nr:hypothetical protein [Tolypothrix bouteillei]
MNEPSGASENESTITIAEPQSGTNQVIKSTLEDGDMEVRYGCTP